MPNKTPDQLIDAMTLAEQVGLLSGQDFWSVAGIERLGVGTFRVTDGPNGARGGGSLIGGVTAASFPVGIAIGASWNPELAGEIGAALADEVKSKGAHMSLAPTVNVHRSVTNGRNFECYSEDPVLTARLAVAYIKGLQNNGISATIKHFAGNESEIERTTINSEIDERTLREIYLVPFEAAVKQAGTWGIMSSYNKLNGTYAAENRWLLTTVLREQWGYDGVVVSDWFGSRSTAPTINAGLDLEMPGPTRDRGDKLIAAVEAGEVSRQTVRDSALRVLKLMEKTGALHDLKNRPERADNRPEHRALIRRAGAEGMVLLKNDGVLPLDASRPGKIAVIGPNARTAQIMGGGSAQLNPHYAISPWDGLVAAIGQDRLSYSIGATNHRFEPVLKGALRADYFDNRELSGTPVHTEVQNDAVAFLIGPVGGGKVDPRKFSVRFTGQFTPSEDGVHRVGIFAAAHGRVLVDGKLIADAWSEWKPGRTFFEEGCDEIVGEIELRAGTVHEVVIELATKPSLNLQFTAFHAGIGRPLGDAAIAEAAEAAANAEVALVFAGRNGEWDTEGSDLTSIELPGRQNELIARVAAANANTIVVLQTGGPVEMPWLGDVKGLLEAWYPGQELGNAVADVLFGLADPGGRLPQSFPVRWSDNPTHSQDLEVYPGLNGKVRYEEGLFNGYRHYDKSGITPLFPFGFGLSYGDFELSDLQVEEGSHGDGALRVHVRVENRVANAGTCVVQVYVRPLDAPVERPEKELKAFAKFRVAGSASQRVSLDLDARDFAYFDVAGQEWVVAAGSYEILAGFSSADIGARAEVRLGAKRLPV